MSQFDTSVSILETDRRVPVTRHFVGTESAFTRLYADDDSNCYKISSVPTYPQVSDAEWTSMFNPVHKIPTTTSKTERHLFHYFIAKGQVVDNAMASSIEQSDRIPSTKRKVLRHLYILDLPCSRMAEVDAHELHTSTSLTNWVRLNREFRWDVDAELVAKAKVAKTVYQAYLDRIEVLKSYAKLDGINYNDSSEQEFLNFLQTSPPQKKGSLYLVDNGNLRVVWKDKEGNHIGLHFLGNSMIRYVIFRRRSAETISRVAGCDSQQGITRHIINFDLNDLVYA